MGSELRMDAYYYGFEPTGDKDIDLILCAIATAGKASHHTDGWNDDVDHGYKNVDGRCPIDWVQNAANKAAKSRSPEWQDISTAPKDGRNYLGVINGEPFICHYDDEEERHRCLHQTDIVPHLPKYWMPFDNLPTPPKEGE